MVGAIPVEQQSRHDGIEEHPAVERELSAQGCSEFDRVPLASAGASADTIAQTSALEHGSNREANDARHDLECLSLFEIEVGRPTLSQSVVSDDHAVYASG
ncbi:hypothetical protein [Sporisorium scitamineum]|uniref:Uncharacterized protein n=1 Tax=Sporisorium scitamineum TaxID=49012 RepID=A0A0F7RYG0_9BASI|nr:hypothetical protein [Sporisorium scitamineum]